MAVTTTLIAAFAPFTRVDSELRREGDLSFSSHVRIASFSSPCTSGRIAVSSNALPPGGFAPCNRTRGVRCQAVAEPKESVKGSSQTNLKEEGGADAVTRKWGLEAGLWKVFSSPSDQQGEAAAAGSKKSQAKELLARYGGAYLATSISLATISFAICYALVSGGVDVATLLKQVGIESDATGEKVGTFALAYAAHKAASPIRFPPTVALTPIVASWFGQKPKEEKSLDDD